VLCRDAATADRLGEVLAQVAGQHLDRRPATPICDLSDLPSVRHYAEDLLRAAEPIDSLVRNAGLQDSGVSEPRWSAQGLELTIGVNHLAHQVLLQRLLSLLLRKQGQSLPVLAWSPGLVIPRSSGGFFRYSRSQNPFGQALFALVARDLLRLTETPQRAGALLAGLATTSQPDHVGFQY